jgi:hypothetical protein
VALFRRRRGASNEPSRSERREEVDGVRRHLEDFVRTRTGVEAFVEPATTVTPPTVLLVAESGEWTRRRVGDPALVRGLARDLAVPVYDVNLVGYPKRMRDFNERQRLEAKRQAGETPG